MESQFRIADLGHVRRVELSGRLYGYAQRAIPCLLFETTYSEGLIRLIAGVKGIAFLKDEIDRESHPEYLLKPMRRLIARFVDPNANGDVEVLDYGCGGGASSVNLARIFPTARITGVDISPRVIRIANARIREFGLQNRISVRHVTTDEPVPFVPGRFDIVMCDGVIEHIPRQYRALTFQTIWRAMRRGGHLFIRETPNRLFPFDGHTSRLPVVHWLPLPLSGPIVRALSPRKLRHRSNATLVDSGLMGVTYFEVLRRLRAGGGMPQDLTRSNPMCVDDFFYFWLIREHRPLHRTIKLAVRNTFRFLQALARPLGVPAAALLPSLDLCIRKDG